MPVRARWLDIGAASAAEAGWTVVYARVSSHDWRHDLVRQVARVTDWATSSGCVVGEVACGVGVERERPKLRRILSGPSAWLVIVEHRDRLARLGVEYLEAALSAQGRRIVAADRGETTDDLVRDMTGVLTSMCARLCGRRGARSWAMRAVTATRQAEPVEVGGGG